METIVNNTLAANTVNATANSAVKEVKPRKRRRSKVSKSEVNEASAAQTVASVATEVNHPVTSTSAPVTKVCSCCGRILPITKFRLCRKDGNKRYNTCGDCMTAKRAASLHEKALSNPRGIAYTPQPGKKAILSIADFTDSSLFAELKRRGWGGQLTKTETATI